MKVIAVSNSKGGVDKTTTALTLYYVLARRGHRTLLIDADLDSIPTRDTHLAVKEIHTLFNSISWLEDDVCSKGPLLSILLINVSKHLLTNA